MRIGCSKALYLAYLYDKGSVFYYFFYRDIDTMTLQLLLFVYVISYGGVSHLAFLKTEPPSLNSLSAKGQHLLAFYFSAAIKFDQSLSEISGLLLLTILRLT